MSEILFLTPPSSSSQMEGGDRHMGLQTEGGEREGCIAPSPEITLPIQARQPNHYPDN